MMSERIYPFIVPVPVLIKAITDVLDEEFELSSFDTNIRDAISINAAALINKSGVVPINFRVIRNNNLPINELYIIGFTKEDYWQRWEYRYTLPFEWRSYSKDTQANNPIL